MHIPVEIILMILNYLPVQEQFLNYHALFGRKFAKREIQKKGVTLYLGNPIEKEITKILVHHRIKIINKNAFLHYKINTAILQKGIETIRSGAFEYCCELKYINFPSTLTEIQYWAFSNTKLDTIDLSLTKLKKIDFSCFCRNFSKKIILPKKVEVIEHGGFCENDIEEISFPDTIIYLGCNCFMNCLNLTKIDLLTTKIKVFNEECFKNCRKLEEIIFPENLVKIFDKCFMNTAVTHIKLPDSVTFLGKYAFGFCNLLSSVEFGKSLTVIDMGCFYNCSNLNSVNSEICINLHSIGEKAFMNNKSLDKFDFPQSVKTIGTGAFRYTSALKQAILPRNLDTIGNTAFGWSGITKVSIPRTIKELPYGVFRNTQLTDVFIPNEIQIISEDAFRDCLKLNLKLYK